MTPSAFRRAAGLLVFIASAASAQVKIDLSRRVTPDCDIQLQGPVAKIRVTGWDYDSIAVIGSLAGGAKLQPDYNEGKGATRGVILTLTGPPGQIRPAGEIELRIPRGATLLLHPGSADIEVSSLTGDVTIEMLGGAARINASPRMLSVDAIYAALTLDGSPGRVHLKSFQGDIVMRGGSADADFSTASGNIRVSGGTFGRTRFDATTGSVTFAGDLGRDASMYITTHSAPVDLQLTPKASAAITATSLFGTIENFLTKTSPSTSGKGQELKADLAGGNAHIVIESYKGDVRITKRAIN